MITSEQLKELALKDDRAKACLDYLEDLHYFKNLATAPASEVINAHDDLLFSAQKLKDELQNFLDKRQGY